VSSAPTDEPELPDLAGAIEHTLLRATATPAEISAACDEAVAYGFCGVCVNPRYVRQAAARLRGAPPVVVSVVAFPLGASAPEVAAVEASRAVADGAAELDMVIPVGEAVAGNDAAVREAIERVRQASPGATLKVILETACFGHERLVQLATLALDAGADYLKTSTGYGPRGATTEDVRVLTSVAKGRARVKAAGGIRTADAARELLAAGARRLGTSSGVSIVSAARR
jgi:deoxyribose-phosphate aldolase